MYPRPCCLDSPHRALLFTSGRIFTPFEIVFCVNVPQLRAADDQPQIVRTTGISVLAILKPANENVLINALFTTITPRNFFTLFAHLGSLFAQFLQYDILGHRRSVVPLAAKR